MSIATIAAKAARKVVGDISTPEAQAKFAEARAVAERDLTAALHLASVANGEERAISAFEAEHGVPLSVEDRAGAAHAVDVAKYQELRQANPFQAARVGLGNETFAYAPGMSEGTKTEQLRVAQRLSTESNPPAPLPLGPFEAARASVAGGRAAEAAETNRDPVAEAVWSATKPDPSVDMFGNPKGGSK